VNSEDTHSTSSRKVEANLVIVTKLNLYGHNCHGDRNRDNLGPHHLLCRLGTSSNIPLSIVHTTSRRDDVGTQHYTSCQTGHRPKSYVSYYTFICFRMPLFSGLCFSLLLHWSERHSVSGGLYLHYHRNQNDPNIHYDLYCNVYP
jgi:hypothetical protein